MKDDSDIRNHLKAKNMTNDNPKAVSPKIPLFLTLEINSITLQVSNKILCEGQPGVSIQTPNERSGITIPLSLLTSAVADLNRFWNEYYPKNQNNQN